MLQIATAIAAEVADHKDSESPVNAAINGVAGCDVETVARSCLLSFCMPCEASNSLRCL